MLCESPRFHAITTRLGRVLPIPSFDSYPRLFRVTLQHQRRQFVSKEVSNQILSSFPLLLMFLRLEAGQSAFLARRPWWMLPVWASPTLKIKVKVLYQGHWKCCSDRQDPSYSFPIDEFEVDHIFILEPRKYSYLDLWELSMMPRKLQGRGIEPAFFLKNSWS